MLNAGKELAVVLQTLEISEATQPDAQAPREGNW
jgi:hypothetical protein